MYKRKPLPLRYRFLGFFLDSFSSYEVEDEIWNIDAAAHGHGMVEGLEIASDVMYDQARNGAQVNTSVSILYHIYNNNNDNDDDDNNNNNNNKIKKKKKKKKNSNNNAPCPNIR